MREAIGSVRLEGAGAAYRGRPVLDAVSIEIPAGELAIVVGPNGAGKSTLLKMMTGELAPARGRVLLDGRDIAGLPPALLARRRAVLPQSSGLAFPFTVAEVVRIGLRAGGRRQGGHSVAEALSRVELTGFSDRLYQELSGGEQQRVHLARVLCQVGAPVEDGKARFLFLDEPVSSLDIRHQLGVLRTAREFAEGGGGVVAVLHDLNLAAFFADRMIVVGQGRIVGDGEPADVLTDAVIADVFKVGLRVGVAPPGAAFVLPHSAARGE